MSPLPQLWIALAVAVPVPSLAAVPVPASPAQDEAFFVDASIELEGELLDWRFLQLDDGPPELVLALAPRPGERELRVHRFAGDTLSPTASEVVPMLEDVLAWGAADVREEAGRELLLFTRAGVWSYSLTKSGYRGNAAPLARTPLLYDFPDARALEHWGYVLPASGGDLVLVPETDGMALWGPAADADGYARRCRYPLPVEEPDEEEDDDGFARLELRLGTPSPFLGEEAEAAAGREGALFSAALQYDAPALVDLDGDGALDLLQVHGDELRVHLGGAAGPPLEPTRVEALPDELRSQGDVEVELRLVDLDGDGDLDLLAVASEEADGFENGVQRILIHRQEQGRLVQERAGQVLRFEAAFLVVDVTDVDGDGRVDLALRKLVLPSLVGTVTGLEFQFEYLVYLGERRGFGRKPVLRQVETYDEESITSLAANRELALDCDGDGLADLVELDLEGRVAVRRLRKSSSFFGGDSWELDESPWRRFDGGGEVESLTVGDWNGDGLGDIASASEERLTLLLSRRRAR